MSSSKIILYVSGKEKNFDNYEFQNNLIPL